MIERETFEKWYKSLHEQLIDNPSYLNLIDCKSSREETIGFVKRICRAHLRSPQILGFLYAVSPPNSRLHVEHNLLEEMGYEHEGAPSHPDLLKRLGTAVGLSDSEWANLEQSAEQVIRNKGSEPLMFATLAESGLNVMLEVFSFEWVLARESRKIGVALQSILGLEKNDLEWFFHHSEVDIAHAEQGLDTLVDYVSYYELDNEAVEIIAEITFRDNVFLKRYFDLQVESMIASRDSQ